MAAATAATATPRRAGRSLLTSPLLAVALIAALVVGVYFWGPDGQTKQTAPVAMADQSTSAPTTAAAATRTPVDPAKVQELMTKIAANPKDTDSLARLGDMYFAAEDYTRSAQFRQKILDTEPRNTDVLLAAGVAYFNARDVKTAEARWVEATRVDPKKAEAYYDLGFLELSKTPPNSAKAKEYWDKVVELDGNGPLAQKVQNHMGALMTPAPGAPASSGAAPTPKS